MNFSDLLTVASNMAERIFPDNPPLVQNCSEELAFAPRSYSAAFPRFSIEGIEGNSVTEIADNARVIVC